MRIKAGLPALALVGAVFHASGAVEANEASGQGAASAAQPAASVTAAPRGHYGRLDSLPDWGGAWFLTSERTGRQPPKLKGPYLAAYEKWRADVRAKDGLVPAAQSNCTPPGMPVIMGVGQYPVEFLFTPGRVTVHFEAWMQWRNIYTDGRKHPEDLDPSFYGSSIGRWEGDTLVVETVGLKEDLGLTPATRGPIPAHSAKLRILERIRLDPKDANILTVDMTLEDPEALVEPHRQTLTYRRDRAQELMEFVCAENDRNPVDAQGNTTFIHE
jgi:hypothetical protein